MRIVRNSGYGYPSMGGNDASVTNQNSLYDREFEQSAVEHEQIDVEPYASMKTRYKTHTFTVDSAANGNISPWTDGLEQVRDNHGCSSVVGISGKGTPITHVGYMDPIGEENVAPGAKKGLISLTVPANDSCTFQGDKEKLVVWNESGKKIIHAPRDVCYRFISMALM